MCGRCARLPRRARRPRAALDRRRCCRSALYRYCSWCHSSSTLAATISSAGLARAELVMTYKIVQVNRPTSYTRMVARKTGAQTARVRGRLGGACVKRRPGILNHTHCGRPAKPLSRLDRSPARLAAAPPGRPSRTACSGRAGRGGSRRKKGDLHVDKNTSMSIVSGCNRSSPFITNVGVIQGHNSALGFLHWGICSRVCSR